MYFCFINQDLVEMCTKCDLIKDDLLKCDTVIREAGLFMVLVYK